MKRILLSPDATRLGDVLKESLSSADWGTFRAAIAFVKYSGVKHIYDELKQFVQNKSVKISVGVDTGGTSYDGLSGLFSALDNKGEVWVFHNQAPSTFHPKIYLFFNNEKASLIIGSGNLTEGGLFSNYEINLQVELDLNNEEDKTLFLDIQNVLDEWSSHQDGLCLKLDEGLLAQLEDEGLIMSEAIDRADGDRVPSSVATSFSDANQTLFSWTPVNPAPRASSTRKRSTQASSGGVIEEFGGKVRIFAMTLQNTDVGKGQTTPGTSRRSPEIYIPLIARNFAPDFWGWPNKFIEDPKKLGKWDRSGVVMRLGTQIINVNMMTWPDKSDFRLRSEALRSAGNINDILVLKLLGEGAPAEYNVEVIIPSSQEYARYLAICNNSVKGKSLKKWGYTE